MKFRILIIISVILITALVIWMGINIPKNPLGQERRFLVEKGQSFLEISKSLEKEELITDEFYSDLYLVLTGGYRQLKAGEYLLSSAMTIPEIAQRMILGDVVKEKITIIEGWNLRDIGWYLENKGMFQAEELFELVGFPAIDYSKATDLPMPKDFSDEFDFLKDKPKNLGLEGYLFPDTYFIDTTFSTIVENVSLTKLEKVVKKILQNFDRKLTPELKEEINQQEKTIFEIVTMASMIEKEVRTSEDKKVVSGIFWKRLGNNIPLQVDATITYITGKKTTKISKEETQIDSPYNTYKYQGLPLGPICNPGLESILASLYPESSEYWYYLSIPDGQTLFSETLEEHNIKKARYLK